MDDITISARFLTLEMLHRPIETAVESGHFARQLLPHFGLGVSHLSAAHK
jgi:hypothetical protein